MQILPLQSLKAEKEQSLAEHLEEDEETGEVYSRRSGTVGSFRQTHRQRKGSASPERHRRGSKRHHSDDSSRNRGVKERDEKDREKLDGADDSSKEQQVYAKLLEKSKLYDKLVSGQQEDTQEDGHDEQEDSAPLVDFERKRFEMLKQKYGDDPSKIVRKLQEERDKQADGEQILGREGEREFERIEQEVGDKNNHGTAASVSSSQRDTRAREASNEFDVHRRARAHFGSTGGKRNRDEDNDNTVEIEDEFGRIRRVPKGYVLTLSPWSISLLSKTNVYFRLSWYSSQIYYEWRQNKAIEKAQQRQEQYGGMYTLLILTPLRRKQSLHNQLGLQMMTTIMLWVLSPELVQCQK